MSKYSYLLESLFPLSIKQKELLDRYYHLLVENAKNINLTTILLEEDVYIKHFYDSILCILKEKDLENKRLLDIGSGAGLPGIVLKIINPSLNVTLLEATKKKCLFLEEVIKCLDLKGIEVVNQRAECYVKDNFEKYDYVTARAVASLNVILELATGFLKIDGAFLAMKGSSYEEEIKASSNALQKLNAKIVEIYIYDLPKDSGKRCIIKIKKLKTTPKIYPRTYAKIKQKPL